MPAMIIYYGIGPLPQTATFDAPSDAPMMFVLSGTTTTQGAAPTLTGITLSLDGNIIGQPAVCWANNNNNHTAMMPTYIPVDNLSEGGHTIEINNMSAETTTDANDFFQVVLLY